MRRARGKQILLSRRTSSIAFYRISASSIYVTRPRPGKDMQICPHLCTCPAACGKTNQLVKWTLLPFSCVTKAQWSPRPRGGDACQDSRIFESNTRDEEIPYNPDIHLTMPQNNLALASRASASGKTFREHLDESYTVGLVWSSWY